MIKIELTDLPEFEKDLKITITLQKDKEGNVGENVKVFPDHLSSSFNLSESTEKKEENNKMLTDSISPKVLSGEGIEKEGIDSLSVTPSSPETLETKTQSSGKQKTPKKKKVSGNLMDLDF